MPTSVTLFCLSGFSHVHHFLRPSLPPPSRLLPVSFPPLPAFLPVFFPLPSRVFPRLPAAGASGEHPVGGDGGGVISAEVCPNDGSGGGRVAGYRDGRCGGRGVG